MLFSCADSSCYCDPDVSVTAEPKIMPLRQLFPHQCFRFHVKLQVFPQKYKNKTKNKNSLPSIVKVASKIFGLQQLSLADIYDRQVLLRPQSILSSSDHPLLEEFVLLPSGQTYRSPRVKTNRFKFSFVPSVINALNLH